MFQYAHGCDTCPRLQSYVGNKTYETVRNETLKRDCFIREWIAKVAALGAASVTYQVFSDCPKGTYAKKNLEAIFNSKPTLNKLISGYPTKQFLFTSDLQNCNEEMTFIAVVRGRCEDPDANPLFVWQDDGKNRSFVQARDTGNRDLLVTKDMFHYLTVQHKFRVTHLVACFFYKRCLVFNKVYADLIQQRARCADSGDSVGAALIKTIVNYSAGYFGLNDTGQAKTFKDNRIVKNLWNGNILDLSKIELHNSGSVGTNTYHFISKPKKVWDPKVYIGYKKRRQSRSALPLHLSIVEFGKLKLGQIFTFLKLYVPPTRIKILYCHVDNYLVCCAGETLDETVDPNLRFAYHFEKQKYFGSNVPGKLKLEWECNSKDDWSFVTPMSQNWALKSNSIKLHKASSLTGLSSTQAYEAALKLLDGLAVEIPQTVRVNKLHGMQKITKTYTVKQF